MVRALQIERFCKAVRSLNALLLEVKAQHPEANFYLQEDELHLLSGPSHDERGRPRPERSLVSETLRNSGGGGW